MSTKKILVAGRLAPEGIARLEAEGFRVDVAGESDAAGLARLVPGYHGLVAGPSVGVPSDVIRAADVLEVIGRTGARVDDIDLGEATARGIIVTDAPQSDRVSAAEVVLAALLACAHEIVRTHDALGASTAGSSPLLPGVEVRGKTLGLIGLDDAAPLVAEAAQALGMRVIAWDPGQAVKGLEPLLERVDELADVCREADFISVHLAELPEYAGLVGEAEFAVMKPGVRLISAFSRSVVDEAAWARAIRSGAVAGSAVVADAEADRAADPLAAFDGVILVDRAAAQTLDAQVRAAETVAGQVAAALRGELVRNAVNVPAALDDEADELMPYVGLCAQLGSLVVQLADGPARVRRRARTGAASRTTTRASSRSGSCRAPSRERAESKVNLVNAQVLADAAGLTHHRDQRPGGLGLPAARLRLGRGAWGQVSVTGTSLGPEHKPRLVEVFGDAIDIGPAPRMLVPALRGPARASGGRLGTLLGEWGVNIGNMSVGRGASSDTR